MTKKCYLAGPMRGCHLLNFPTFFEVAAVLRWHGWDVFCPAEMDMGKGYRPHEPMESAHNSEVWSLEGAFVKDFEAIMAGDAIFMLPGWVESTGAQAEYAVARLTGKPVYEIVEARLRKDKAPVLELHELQEKMRLGLEL